MYRFIQCWGLHAPPNLRITLLVVAASVILITGCSSTSKVNSITSEQRLYEEALNNLNRSQFILAVEALEKLESDFPFGKYANSAQLALIYAYYKTDEPELADASASRFIRLHPNHPNVDYAWYMRGLSNFPKPASLFQTALGTDLSERNPKKSQTAFIHFSELVRRFPNSQYAPEATKRMEYLRNLLARHEIHVANYYMSRDAWLAAANRGRYVVENFQYTPAVPDALAIMVQSYNQLGMSDLETDALAVLKQNFPEYPALNDQGEFNYRYYVKDTTSIIGFLTFGVIDTSEPPGFDTREKYGKF